MYTGIKECRLSGVNQSEKGHRKQGSNSQTPAFLTCYWLSGTEGGCAPPVVVHTADPILNNVSSSRSPAQSSESAMQAWRRSVGAPPCPHPLVRPANGKRASSGGRRVSTPRAAHAGLFARLFCPQLSRAVKRKELKREFLFGINRQVGAC